MTITDDDTDVVLSVHPLGVVEQAGAHEVTVTARFDGASSSALAAASPVAVTVGPGDSDPVTVAASCSAIGTDDVCTDQSNNRFTVSIPAGAVSGSGSFRLTARDDSDNSEDIENVKLSGSSSLGSVTDAVLGVYDPDRELVLSFHETSAGEAVLASVATVEGPETVRFTASALGYLPASADLSITEAVRLTLSRASVAETDTDAAAGGVSVTASFPGASSSDLTAATDVTLSFAAGDDAEGADFTAPGTPVTVSIPAGAFSGSGVALSGLTITGDDIAEGSEVIDVGGSAEGFRVEGAALTIADNDLGVTVEADTDSGTSQVDNDLSEGAAVGVRVRARLDSATTNELDSALEIRVTAGASSPASAVGGGVDFTAPATPATVLIPTGAASLLSSWLNLTGLGVTDDAVTEPAETFLITGRSTRAGVAVTPDTLTIGASDTGLEVTAEPSTVVESSASYTVTVTAGFDGAASSVLATASTVTVTVATGGTGEATVASSGYLNALCPGISEDVCTDQTGNSFTVSIPAGQTSNTGTFRLRARDDSDNTEGAEKVKISGSAAVAGRSESDSFDLTVVDSGVTLALSSSGSAVSSVAEGSGTTTVRVTVTLPVNAPLGGAVVGLRIASTGTASGSSDSILGVREDYWADLPSAPSGTPDGYTTGVTITAGQTSGYVDIPVAVNDDNVNEDTETVVIEGSTVTINGVAYSTVAASLSISDNDTAPANIDLTLFDNADGAHLTQAAEDGGDVVVRVRAAFQGAVTRSAATPVPVTVGTSGEATAGADYTSVPAFDVVIPAYASEGTHTFTLAPTDDESLEGPETVTVGGTLAGYTITADTLTIADDDFAVTLTFLDSASEPVTEISEGTNSTSLTLRAATRGLKPLPIPRPLPWLWGEPPTPAPVLITPSLLRSGP